MTEVKNLLIDTSALRCKDGDIALVIHDSKDCEQNVGKVVFVRGPAKLISRSGMKGWRIKSLHPSLWAVEDQHFGVKLELLHWGSDVFHEDDWLLPLRPEDSSVSWWQVQQEIDRHLIGCGHVTSHVTAIGK
jgi:hypothetical protein